MSIQTVKQGPAYKEPDELVQARKSEQKDSAGFCSCYCGCGSNDDTHDGLHDPNHDSLQGD
ncbi:MAG: hypothetical protein ABR924_02590 [Terracidiphilus sp.]|jgi:hypothetical protein